MIENDIETVVKRSFHEDRTVVVEMDKSEAIFFLGKYFGLQDRCLEEDGSIDVWGKHDGEEWRLKIVEPKK